MLVKGTIIQIDYLNECPKALAHIDVFDSPNKEPINLWCNISYPPGMSDSYKVNDLVYISFLENEIGKPVIIGRLYSSLESNKGTEVPNGYMNLQNLDVGGRATLPLDTTIGDIHGYDIKNAVANSLL